MIDLAAIISDAVAIAPVIGEDRAYEYAKRQARHLHLDNSSYQGFVAELSKRLGL